VIEHPIITEALRRFNFCPYGIQEPQFRWCLSFILLALDARAP
jgi:hypothetical protein